MESIGREVTHAVMDCTSKGCSVTAQGHLVSQFVLNGPMFRDDCDGLMLAIGNGLVLEVVRDLCLMELSMTGCRQRVTAAGGG